MNDFPIKEIKPNNSILFLGSGFTRDATNIKGTTIPIVSDLQTKLAKELGFDPAEYDLKLLAQEFDKHPGDGFYQYLYKTFTISALTSAQMELLS